MIKVVSVGKIKNKELTSVIEDYERRLIKYTNLKIIEVDDVSYDDVEKSIELEYQSIMKQVKEYIIPTVTETKELHCGLGFKIRSDRPEADVRTLNNALNQFWSILRAIGINELHHRIDETFVSPDTVQVTSTIYDSIYGICLADPEVLHWLNFCRASKRGLIGLQGITKEKEEELEEFDEEDEFVDSLKA